MLTYEKILELAGITEEAILPDHTLLVRHETRRLLTQQPGLISCLGTYRMLTRANPEYKVLVQVDYKPPEKLLQLATQFGFKLREIEYEWVGMEPLPPVIMNEGTPELLEQALQLWAAEDR